MIDRALVQDVCFANHEALQNCEALLPNEEAPRHQVKCFLDMGKTDGGRRDRRTFLMESEPSTEEAAAAASQHHMQT